MIEHEIPEYQRFASEMADAAGTVLRRYFRVPLTVESKEDASPVTRADREAEDVMRTLIASRYFAHGIFGEEHERINAEAEYQWVLDPIDGTRAFTCGIPTFTTLVALAHGGMPVIGIIDQPVTGERWAATYAQTLMNGTPVQVSTCRELHGARIASTSTYYFTGPERARFDRLREKGAQLHLGGDAYLYAMMASGYIDAVVDAGLKPYDFCAVVPVVQGAGGIITDWDGQPLHIGSAGRVIAAATPELHAALMRGLS